MMDLLAVIPVGEIAETGSTIDALMRWVKVETAWELGVVVFGLVAQLAFLGRWIVQWAASEKRGESHVPELFWWLSLTGASMLMIYYILRGEPVGIIGQSVGWTVYTRNLYLIRVKHRRVGAQSAKPSSDGDSSDARDPH